jgi:chromosome partitioning protein
MPALTLTFLNQKGGVGKSSTTFHLAGTLATQGKRILLLDLDPQASLTQAFIGPDAMRSLSARESIASLFGDDIPPAPSQLIRSTQFSGISIAPGSTHLTEFNVPMPHRAPRDQQRAIASFVNEVRDSFDFILIDCAPNLHLCSWAALVASDFIIVPLQAEDFGSQGIASVLDSIEAVQSKANRRLVLMGYLLTMFNPRLAIHKAYEGTLRDLYGDQVFDTTIPIGTDFKEAIALRKPIIAHKPKGASAKSIKALSDEILSRSCTVQDGKSVAGTIPNVEPSPEESCTVQEVA